MRVTHKLYPEARFIVKAVPKDTPQEYQCIEKLLRMPSPRNHTVPADLVECSSSYLIFMSCMMEGHDASEGPVGMVLELIMTVLEACLHDRLVPHCQ